jgi:DNA-binding transcriptional regulator YiaG
MTIKQMRTLTRLSQSKFAKLTGLPAANVARWEQGGSHPPVYVEQLVEYFLRSKNLLPHDTKHRKGENV